MRKRSTANIQTTGHELAMPIEFGILNKGEKTNGCLIPWIRSQGMIFFFFYSVRGREKVLFLHLPIYYFFSSFSFCSFHIYITSPTPPPLLFPILPLRFNLTITFAIGVLRISRALRLKLHTLCTIYHRLTCVMFQTAAPRGYSSRLLLCWSAAETTEAPFFPSPFIFSPYY